MPTDPVRASVFVQAPPELVYEYFTRPESIVRWMGDYALVEPKPNGRFTLDVHGAPVRGRYLEVEPPYRLLISWGYAGSERLAPGASTVEVRLTAESDGTRVELEHRDLPQEDIEGHASGWTHYLARLQATAAKGDAGPDPGMPPSQPTPA
jgi:uncharacterized protein YndB with AHSA1/START domain